VSPSRWLLDGNHHHSLKGKAAGPADPSSERNGSGEGGAVEKRDQDLQGGLDDRP
jgi:hypothetical protein